jgi:hypothetical protein
VVLTAIWVMNTAAQAIETLNPNVASPTVTKLPDANNHPSPL